MKVTIRFLIKCPERLLSRLVFHVPGDTFQVLLLGLFINGPRIDLSTDAAWETWDNINWNYTGLRAKKEKKEESPSPHEERDPWIDQEHVGRMLKFHFVWQCRWIPQEEVKNQLEQGASISQIALDSPVLETLILIGL